MMSIFLQPFKIAQQTKDQILLHDPLYNHKNYIEIFLNSMQLKYSNQNLMSNDRKSHVATICHFLLVLL